MQKQKTKSETEPRKTAAKMLKQDLVVDNGNGWKLTNKAKAALKANKKHKKGFGGGKIPRYSQIPTVNQLVTEIKKKYDIDQMKTIAMRLLTHELIKEPPEIVANYGEIMKMTEAQSYEFNCTKKQAWIMARDDYFEKMGSGEK